MEKPFVHFIRMPDETEVCFTGNENVNPSSLLLTDESSGSPSFSTNSFSEEAIKSNRSCHQKNTNFNNTNSQNYKLIVKNSRTRGTTQPPH